MRYLSVCSGIEAASVAWAPLDWQPVAFAEIEPFPSAVLKHHYPEVPNLGDITQFRKWPDVPVDLLVGGTPCQSFSVAGLRAGLADPRGNLALTYLAIADRYRPRWLVWENVPGVLSSGGGRHFGAFLGGLAKLGYGWAYRVLDAQYCRVDGFPRAVPQRRRRLFVVGNCRDWRRAAAVLFDAESLRGNPPPRRQAGQDPARPLAGGSRTSGGYRNDADTAENLIANAVPARPWLAHREDSDTLIANPLTHRMGKGVNTTADEGQTMIIADQTGMLRRLTPLECERLQGFPDDYTLIRRRGKPAADSSRYKALGNSMAVNVMRWLGRRIALIEESIA